MRFFCLNNIRNYASSPPRRPNPPLSLPAFLLRQQVLSLYRTVLRTTHQLPKSAPTRHELRGFARAELERNRSVCDLVHVRYLLSGGRAEVERLKGLVGGASGEEGKREKTK